MYLSWNDGKLIFLLSLSCRYDNQKHCGGTVHHEFKRVAMKEVVDRKCFFCYIGVEWMFEIAVPLVAVLCFIYTARRYLTCDGGSEV